MIKTLSERFQDVHLLVLYLFKQHKKLGAVWNFILIFKDPTAKLLCPKFKQMPAYKLTASIVQILNGTQNEYILTYSISNFNRKPIPTWPPSLNLLPTILIWASSTWFIEAAILSSTKISTFLFKLRTSQHFVACLRSGFEAKNITFLLQPRDS